MEETEKCCKSKFYDWPDETGGFGYLFPTHFVSIIQGVDRVADKLNCGRSTTFSTFRETVNEIFEKMAKKMTYYTE